MRADAVGRRAGFLIGLAAAAGCGRVGYDQVAIVDAAGGAGSGGFAGMSGSGGRGGASAAAGTGGGGTGGAVGGSSSRGGAGGAVGGSSAGGGAGGSSGMGGAGGSSGMGGAGGSSGAGGAAGVDGGAAISCAPQTFGGHDYLFCDALVDWATARAECERRGMRLVRVDDAAENTWLQANAVFSASMFRRENLWLGGSEPTTDGDWRWTDGAAFWSGAANGTAVGGLYTNWDSREPNNVNGPEACLSMMLNGTTWFDWLCSAAQYFACEVY